MSGDEIAGLDRLELGPAPTRGGAGRRVWAAAWPKLLAIAIVICGRLWLWHETQPETLKN